MFCNLIFCVPHYNSLIKCLLKGSNPYYFVLLEKPSDMAKDSKGQKVSHFIVRYSIFYLFIVWERDAEKLVSVMPSIFCLFASFK